MQPFDFFKLTLDFYARNDLQEILKNQNILRGGKYHRNQFITAIKTSPVGVEPQLICSASKLFEIRICLDKSPIPHYIKCPSQGTSCPIYVLFP